MANCAQGVEVEIPTLPQNCEAAVVEVAKIFPTVSCEEVASIFPEEALYHSGMLAPSEVLFVPPFAIPKVPASVIVPEVVIAPPEVVKPVVPPETSTEVTVPEPPAEAHVPLIWIQPLVSTMPFENVDEAVVEVTLIKLVERPPVRVEVAVVVPVK